MSNGSRRVARGRERLAWLLCAAGLSGLPGAPAWSASGAVQSDADVLVTYQVSTLASDGVLRTEQWRERLIRRSDRLWIERQLPTTLPDEQRQRTGSGASPVAGSGQAGEAEGGHRHFDYTRSARYVQRLPDGSLQLAYVDRQRRIIVAVPQAEFGSVGFTPDWQANANLIAPAVVGEMPLLRAGDRGAPWRVQQTPGWQHRVRWSDALQMPARIESSSDDGRGRRVITVVPVAGGGAKVPPPWLSLEGYSRRQYDDFTD